MCSYVDGLVKDMNGEISKLDQEIDELSESAISALELRNRSDALIAALDAFKEKYLGSTSPPNRSP